MMTNSAALAALVAISAIGQSLPEEVIEKQNEVFQRWWNTEFVWTFDDLPTTGTVPKHRLPYSGYIYPDTAGGTVSALRKYDRAFNGRRYPAVAHERWDTTAYGETVRVGGLFFSRTVTRTPHWHGHCNGWAAATIRHAQPKHSVVRNGVTFTPADIKGLLAELYIYNEMDVLAGTDTHLSAPLLHTIITNWIGRGAHPIAMEADPGKEKWNYPIYAYATSHAKRGNHVQVRMNIAYAKDSRGEFQQSPLYKAQKYFHYYLQLDDAGKIVGGGYYRDSSRIDMLWIPLRPKASKQPGNERGNPYIDVDTILSIWRDSVPEETRKQWFVIDQPEGDRVYEIPQGLARLVPVQEFPAIVEAQAPAPPAENTAAADAANSADEPADIPERGENNAEEPAAAVAAEETSIDTEANETSTEVAEPVTAEDTTSEAEANPADQPVESTAGA